MRTLFAFALACVVSIIGTPGNVARANQDQGEGRYYAGIGVGLQPLVGNQTMVVDTVPDGPAARAGLREGDIVVEIDGVDAKELSIDGIVEKIKAGAVGEPIHFKVKRHEGDAYSTIEVTAVRALLDSVAQLEGVESRSRHCKSDQCYSIESKFSENKSTGLFTYEYKISSTFQTQIYVDLEVLNMLVDDVDSTRRVIVVLAPHESKLFGFASTSLPAKYIGRVCILEHSADEDIIQRQLFDRGFIALNNVLAPTVCGETGVIAPKKYLPKK